MGNGSRATGWPESGVTLSQAPGEKNSIAAVSDGQGGAYISWSNSGANDDIMIQHVGVSGAILSSGSANGAIVCSAPGTRGESVCAPDGAQGALVAWADARGSSGRDIYVQRVTPNGAVATLLAIVDTDITADHVRLRWHAAALAGMPVVVERRAGALAWEPLEEARADAGGLIEFEDRAIAPGAAYDYRVSWTENGVTHHGGETRALIPHGVALAMSAPTPSPARSCFELELSVPNGRDASIELLDVTGRLLERRTLRGTGVAPLRVRVGDGGRLAPGVYLLRLADGASSISRRAALVR